jgi:hypothetical protein
VNVKNGGEQVGVRAAGLLGGVWPVQQCTMDAKRQWRRLFLSSRSLKWSAYCFAASTTKSSGRRVASSPVRSRLTRS